MQQCPELQKKTVEQINQEFEQYKQELRYDEAAKAFQLCVTPSKKHVNEFTLTLINPQEAEMLLIFLKKNPQITEVDVTMKFMQGSVSQARALILISGLKQNTTVKSLALAGIILNEALAKEIAANKTLTALRIKESRVDDNIIELLAMNQEWVCLNLSSSYIKDKGACELAQLPKLRELDLSGNEINDVGYFALSQSKSLKDLNIGSLSSINKDALHALLNNMSIHRLHMQAPTAAQIIALLEGKNLITSININSFERVNSAELAGMLPKLIGNTSLMEITLNNTPIEEYLNSFPDSHKRPNTAQLKLVSKQVSKNAADALQRGELIYTELVHHIKTEEVINIIAGYLNLRDAIQPSSERKKLLSASFFAKCDSPAVLEDKKDKGCVIN